MADVDLYIACLLAHPDALIGAFEGTLNGHLLHLELRSVDSQTVLLHISKHITCDDERVNIVACLFQRLTAFQVLPVVAVLKRYLIGPVARCCIFGSTQNADVQAVADLDVGKLLGINHNGFALVPIHILSLFVAPDLGAGNFQLYDFLIKGDHLLITTVILIITETHLILGSIKAQSHSRGIENSLNLCISLIVDSERIGIGTL